MQVVNPQGYIEEKTIVEGTPVRAPVISTNINNSQVTPQGYLEIEKEIDGVIGRIPILSLENKDDTTAVSQATNTSLGIVKGSTDNFKINVGTDGDMAVNGLVNALNNKANTADIVNADWNATSGLSQILNKPTNFNPYLYKYNWDTIFADSNGRIITFFEGTDASPDGTAALFGLQENTGTGYGMQLGVSQRNKAFFRAKSAGVVGQWNEIWHNGNLPYIEGAWTPIPAGRNGTDGTIIPVTGTYDLQIGRYKRRGNTVCLYGNLQGSITNATALTGHAVVIANVPFNAKAYIAAAGNMQYSFGVAGLSISMGIANFPQNYLYIGRNSNGTSASLSTAVWGTDVGTGFFQIRFSIEYEI